MQANEEDLRKVLADVFGTEPSAISETASVDTIEQWDSLKHLNLVLALEERFSVTLTEEQSVQILSYPLIKIALEEQGVRFNTAKYESE
jgi:acyl carrier protein